MWWVSKLFEGHQSDRQPSTSTTTIKQKTFLLLHCSATPQKLQQLKNYDDEENDINDDDDDDLHCTRTTHKLDIKGDQSAVRDSGHSSSFSVNKAAVIPNLHILTSML